MAYSVRRTTADEWREFRELRLEALLDSPTAFGQTHEQALAHPDELWQERAQTNATSDVPASMYGPTTTTGDAASMSGRGSC
jgi:hypothetical protein